MELTSGEEALMWFADVIIENGHVSVSLENLVMNAGEILKPLKRIACLCAIRIMLSTEGIMSVNELIKCGVLPVLVNAIGEDYNRVVQHEAAGSLAILSSGTPQQKDQIADAGAIPLLVRLLSTAQPMIIENALCALSNIIDDKPNIRDMAIECGIIEPLLSFLQLEIPVSLILRITSVIRNMCTTPLPVHVVNKIMPALDVLIEHTDTGIILNTLWAISNLILGNNEQIWIVIANGMVPKLIQLLKHDDVALLKVAQFAIGNIAKGSNDHTQIVYNFNVLAYTPILLSHEKRVIRLHAMMLLSQMIGGSQSRIQAIIEYGLLESIIEILTNDHIQVKKEAGRAIKMLIEDGSNDQVRAAIDSGVIPALCVSLSCPDLEFRKIVLHSLILIDNKDGLDTNQVANLIGQCDGLDEIIEIIQGMGAYGDNIRTILLRS